MAAEVEDMGFLRTLAGRLKPPRACRVVPSSGYGSLLTRSLAIQRL